MALPDGRAAEDRNVLQSLDLSDPLVARHYMAAMHVLHGLPGFDWYDGCFLAKFEAARRMLAIVRPGESRRFAAAFDTLRTRADFEVRRVHDVLPPARFADFLAQLRAVPASSLHGHERGDFGRRIARDLPILAELQLELMPLVAELAGEAVEPCYTFLSLYDGAGTCAPHLDAPSAKWTLDLCLAQSGEWPIHFSSVVPWPTSDADGNVPAATAFRSHSLRPNEALLFSGSSQWHYRDAIPDAGFCHLAFLHYHPAGCADLVRPARWAAHFDMPERAILDAVFETLRPDRRQ